jgi:spore maturation protein CgeB
MGHDVTFLDLGSARMCGDMDASLLRAVRASQPQLLFTFLFGDEVTPESIAEVTASGVTTLNWFADDHWRFETFSKRYAPAFSWIATTAKSALPKYAALGCTQVVATQWGAVPHEDVEGAPRYDVSFVGQKYGNRGPLIERLRRAGISVSTRGTGWHVGFRHRVAARAPVLRAMGGQAWFAHAQARSRCTQMEMAEIFRGSRINLNFTEGSQGGESQIKGRTFEVPACGGFLLTGEAEDLGCYYEIGSEIVTFHDENDLVDKVRYYLAHEGERSDIAKAGHRRTLADHTYERRFSAIFSSMGLAR